MKALNEIVPEKMNIMIMASNLPPGIKYNEYERWFNVPYYCAGKKLNFFKFFCLIFIFPHCRLIFRYTRRDY